MNVKQSEFFQTPTATTYEFADQLDTVITDILKPTTHEPALTADNVGRRKPLFDGQHCQRMSNTR